LAEKKLAQQITGRRKVGKTDYQAQGVLFIPETARFAHLLYLPRVPMSARQSTRP
jgi:type I restriction enzyme M protein